MTYQKKIIFLATVVIILTAVSCFYPKPIKVSVAAKPKDSLTVNVIPLVTENIDIMNEFIGYIIPIQSVELRPNVSGYIDNIYVSGGQEVKVGQPLVKIDQKEYKAQLDAATAAVIQSQADFDNAKHYYERMKKAGKKAVSAAALDEAKAKFLSSEATLKQAIAEKNKAQTLFDYTLLKSPINGIVGHIDITKGNYVSPSSEALFSIIQTNPVQVEFAISDKEYLAQLKKHPDGMLFNSEKIQIRLADNSIYEHSGIFKFNDNTLNRETNSISVYADFENGEKKLMPNSYVDILISKNLKNVFLIRQNYITLNNDGAFVSVMKNGKILRIPLHIVGYYGDYFVADNAFEKNEFLVIDKTENIPPETILTMKITNPEDK